MYSIQNYLSTHWRAYHRYDIDFWDLTYRQSTCELLGPTHYTHVYHFFFMGLKLNCLSTLYLLQVWVRLFAHSGTVAGPSCIVQKRTSVPMDTTTVTSLRTAMICLKATTAPADRATYSAGIFNNFHSQTISLTFPRLSSLFIFSYLTLFFSVSGQCEPVCAQGCVNGTCVSPGVCQCHFGFVGENCSSQCRCNKHSNCKSISQLDTCLECKNNTKVLKSFIVYCYWKYQ